MTFRSRLVRRTAAVVIALLPTFALAHPGHEGGHEVTWDFTNGLVHPFSGWDHLLAAIAVGLWAAQLGGRARWLVPSAFVAMLAIGGACASPAFAVPFIEPGIAASVLVFGLLIATAQRLPVFAGMGVVAFFALFHGLAHGAEIPARASAMPYGIGLVLGSALLAAGGMQLGLLAARHASTRAPKIAGWLIASSGAVLLAL